MERYRILYRWLNGILPAALLLLAVSDSHAQKPTHIQIENADTFEGDESLGKNVSRLLGNVRFSHQGAIMYCDSAYLYQETNSLDAFGKIRIVRGDSLSLTGHFLDYKGNTREARMTGNVVMTDRDMVLESEQLLYDMKSETAFYEDNGRITDKSNVLTSKRGHYYADARSVYFRDSVILVNPQYRIVADTLRYRTDTRTAFFEGPSRIFSTGDDSTVIYCEKGWYNTVTQKSVFNLNPRITSKENSLSADSLVYDNVSREGDAYNNVLLTDTLQKVYVTGDYGNSSDQRKTALVTGKAMLTRAFETDSLFLHADTLFAYADTVTGYRTWQAWHGVRIYKTDFQGKCDSMTYNTGDSLLSFYHDPVLWNNENQLTSSFMQMRVAGSGIRELYLESNAFISAQEDSVRFNQVKGRNMTGYFSDGQLNSIRVEGNGQSIYYARNSNDQFTGVNRADCSDMLILVDSSRISSITMINKPDATLYPIDELDAGELRLKGFSWRSGERPMRKEDIFIRNDGQAR